MDGGGEQQVNTGGLITSSNDDVNTSPRNKAGDVASTADENVVTVRITSEPLSVDAAFASIASPQAGGNSIFIGTTRDSFEGKEVVRLE